MAADVIEEGALVNGQHAGAGKGLVLESAEGNTRADGQALPMAAHQRRRGENFQASCAEEETNHV